MLNSDKTKLKIFENFQIDYNLPKHKKPSTDGVFNNVTSMGGSIWVNDGSTQSTTNNNWFTRLKNWISSNTKKYKEQKEEKKKLDPSEFFTEITSAFSYNEFDSDKYFKRIDGYIATINNARKLGQTALIEKLENEIELVKMESILYGSDKVKTITEEQVIQFYKKSKKGLRLDWIQNFARIIPNKIVKQKIKIDNLNVFDNYVILHYDPNETAFELTKKEKEDPILFGVIRGSRKLYYIADWKDKYCDLTLDTLIDEFGKKAINANDITVKFE